MKAWANKQRSTRHEEEKEKKHAEIHDKTREKTLFKAKKFFIKIHNKSIIYWSLLVLFFIISSNVS